MRPARLGMPHLGFGLGLRPCHFHHLLRNPARVDWFEIISENFMDDHGFSRHVLSTLARSHPIVMHGVSLSIGSADPLDMDYLARLLALAAWVEPAWISDHLCWTGVAGYSTHDLMPLPLTEEALDHVAERVLRVQDFLGRPLVLEALRAPGLPDEAGARVDVAGLAPLLRDELCIVAAPCLRVAELGHDVRGFLSAVDRGEAPAVPEVRASLLAVSRVAYRLVLTDLAPWQRRALASCGSPRPVVVVAEEIAAASGEDMGAALAALLLWLPTAEGLGMVSRTTLASDARSRVGPGGR